MAPKELKVEKPAIFYFQPNTYRILESPDSLKQWEADMKRFVGLAIDHTILSGTCCESVSGGSKDDCDVD